MVISRIKLYIRPPQKQWRAQYSAHRNHGLQSGWATFTCVALLLIFSSPLVSYGAEKNRIFDLSSGPELLYPVTDHIAIAGKDFLEFRWKRYDITRTGYFEFKLYRGYKTVASTLIFKQNFPRDIYPITIPAKLFENNRVYTWSLRQVFMSGEKSDRSFSSFKVIEK